MILFLLCISFTGYWVWVRTFSEKVFFASSSSVIVVVFVTLCCWCPQCICVFTPFCFHGRTLFCNKFHSGLNRQFRRGTNWDSNKAQFKSAQLLNVFSATNVTYTHSYTLCIHSNDFFLFYFLFLLSLSRFTFFSLSIGWLCWFACSFPKPISLLAKSFTWNTFQFYPFHRAIHCRSGLACPVHQPRHISFSVFNEVHLNGNVFLFFRFSSSPSLPFSFSCLFWFFDLFFPFDCVYIPHQKRFRRILFQLFI